ncbi:MAG: phosphoenolpyruvate--protein phosphotransferase [Rhodothermales bacterium]|nr:phosphoenolpyruvate--protein phosphotransferase [Rhodothermales bacterium]
MTDPRNDNEPERGDGGNAVTAGDHRERRLKGIGVAPGITIGPSYLYAKVSFDVDETKIDDGESEAEADRFERAVARSERDLHKIIDVARDKLGDESATIFEAQLLMLRDEALYPEVVRMIESQGMNAGHAVQTVMDKHRRVMQASDSEYLRERANDLEDVQQRIIRHLRRGKLLSAVDPETIIVAENLTAADIILFSRRGILACVTDYGGPTSHVSIMARALGVPAVVGMHDATDHIESGRQVIVDGIRGLVIVDPTEATLEEYRMRQERYHRLVKEDKQLVPLASETLDGKSVPLEANLEFRNELGLLEEYGAEGIGLFRTEMLLLMEGRLNVSEQEHFEIYQEVVRTTKPGSTTFRLLDLGGDKMLPMGHREHNPFLGWRGVRILLQRPDILRMQLRAILRASAFGPTRILIPMVTNVAEVHAVREHISAVEDELYAAGEDFDPDVPVGIMVEVPSVALMADSFAPHVDFMSLGTNDLTQYTLAVDRGNDKVADIYDELHPSVLMLIRRATKAAHDEGIPISLCGELAANIRAIPVLVGLGVDGFSASPVYLPAIKRVIRAMKVEEGRELAERALSATDAVEFRRYLDSWLEEHACGMVFLMDGASNGETG